jgi:predicted MPP superfamily phosphohydrolase
MLRQGIKLQYISDIHLEKRLIIPTIPVAGNYLALLGDIGSPYKDSYKEFLKYTSDNWEKVFLISGNHEYYQKGKYNQEDVDEQIKNVVKLFKNVYYLNQDVYTLYNYNIMGCTLWSTPYIKHTKHLNWLKNNINNYNKVIVLTHFLPSYKLILPKFINHNPTYYASDLEYLIKEPVKWWLCGHTHINHTTTINSIDVCVNAYGHDDIRHPADITKVINLE